MEPAIAEDVVRFQNVAENRKMLELMFLPCYGERKNFK